MGSTILKPALFSCVALLYLHESAFRFEDVEVMNWMAWY